MLEKQTAFHVRHSPIYNICSLIVSHRAAVVFMAFLFIHVNGMLNSWYHSRFGPFQLQVSDVTHRDYFAATFALYFLSFFARNLKTLYNSSFGFGLPASLQTLPDGMLQVNITTPPHVKWAAGQHYIIRFLNVGIHAFSSHPFTVASIPSANGGKNDLELVFAVHGGITKRLKDAVEGKPSKALKVWVDGPYGGPPLPVNQYDHVYLVAGGSGELNLTLKVQRQI